MNRRFILFRIVLVMVFMYSTVFANNYSTKEATEDIMSLVSKVKEADFSERRVLMNQLKVSLRKVNQASRQRIMLQLRKNFTHGRGLHLRMKHSNRQQGHEARNMSMSMHNNKDKKSKRGK